VERIHSNPHTAKQKVGITRVHTYYCTSDQVCMITFFHNWF